MRKTITIGETPVEMLANAATPFRFRQVFRLDLLKGISAASDGTMDNTESVDYIIRLAYILKEQATGKAKFDKLTEEDFYKWLEGFETMDVFNVVDEVAELWLGSQETMSTP